MTNPTETTTIDLEPYLQPAAGVLSAIIIALSIILSANIFNGNVLGATTPTTTTTTTGTAAAPTTATVSIDDDAVLGNKETATMAIVEFSDYECPFCKRHFTDTYQQIKREYIDSGKAILVFRDFPLSFHDPLATIEAMAAECVQDLAGDSKYYEYHDLVFTATTSNGAGLEKTKLYDFAKQIGVDADKFNECLDTEKFKAEVQKDMADGQAVGVSGTPGFIVGKFDKGTGNVSGDIISGAVGFETFKAAFDKYAQ
jgi:protein-disulfide isomerase